MKTFLCVCSWVLQWNMSRIQHFPHESWCVESSHKTLFALHYSFISLPYFKWLVRKGIKNLFFFSISRFIYIYIYICKSLFTKQKASAQCQSWAGNRTVTSPASFIMEKLQLAYILQCMWLIKLCEQLCNDWNFIIISTWRMSQYLDVELILCCFLPGSLQAIRI